MDSSNQYVGYICGWNDKSANYAYLEPLCIIPSYRHVGIARALIYELCNRLLKLGASRLIVLSNSEIYMKIGFKPIEHYFTLGNKIEAEYCDYSRLIEAGIRIPKMLDIDKSNKRMVKEYIDALLSIV